MRRRDFVAPAGAAAAFPRIALAQQLAKLRRVALVSNGTPVERMVIGVSPSYSAFFEQMQSHGLFEGRTISYGRYQVPSGQEASLVPPIIATVPDVIFFNGTSGAALVALATNKTIPMVAFSADLLAAGLVDNLAHPGGNVTGVSTNAGPDQPAELLALLAETVPTAKRFAYVVSGLDGRPANPLLQQQFDVAGAAAVKLGVTLKMVLVEGGVATEANFSKAFTAMAANKLEAAYFANDSTFTSAYSIIAQLALAAKMPTIIQDSLEAEAGGLLAYGPDILNGDRQCADYIALILAGAKPGDLPVLQPTVFNFVVNLKAAKAIGLALPASIIAQATRLIE